jgi:hypothetical protein
MSNKTKLELSQDLQQFIILALGIGIDNLRKQGSLIPMVLTLRGEEIDLSVLAVDADQVMKAAAEHVAELPPETDFYALLFDGKMNVEGEVFQAAIVQAGERGSEHGHTVYQQYDVKTYELIRGPEYAGQAEQFFNQ